ncbi:MAG TPA: J domain-containing protein [Streptosporangiaceae bacterium]|nr:J domain-containing protein [Streptosporangiaceae bacterium]
MNPFDVLGLSANDPVTDDDVRAAWRRIASATHPDREDGGDAGRFALAAAAYNELRTEYGRNEARAASAPPDSAPIRTGFPFRALIRLVIALVAGTAGTLAAPDSATAIALTVGVATWLALTIKR